MKVNTYAVLMLLVGVVAGERYSCYEAEIGTGSFFCDIVRWNRAREIDLLAEKSEGYEVALKPASDQLQEATQLYEAYIQGSKETEECQTQIRQFVCAHTHPLCPVSRASSTYWTLCRSECLKLKSDCGVPLLSCPETMSDNDFECFHLLSDYESQVKLSLNDQPTMVIIHSSFTFVYFVLFVVWCVALVRNKYSIPAICRLLTGLFFLRLIVSIITVASWGESISNFGILPHALSYALLLFELLFQTFLFIVLHLVSKGWCVIYGDMSTGEWLHICVMGILFYVFYCILLVLNIESQPIMFHASCIFISGLLLLESFIAQRDSETTCYQKLWKIHGDGLDAYHSVDFIRYRMMVLIGYALIAKTSYIFIRHIIYPFFFPSSYEVASVFITLLGEFGDGCIVVLMAVLYFPKKDSELFVTASVAESDPIIMASVTLALPLPKKTKMKSLNQVIFQPPDQVAESIQKEYCIGRKAMMLSKEDLAEKTKIQKSQKKKANISSSIEK